MSRILLQSGRHSLEQQTAISVEALQISRCPKASDGPMPCRARTRKETGPRGGAPGLEGPSAPLGRAGGAGNSTDATRRRAGHVTRGETEAIKTSLFGAKGLALGQSSLGWTVRTPDLPRILSATSHEKDFVEEQRQDVEDRNRQRQTDASKRKRRHRDGDE